MTFFGEVQQKKVRKGRVQSNEALLLEDRSRGFGETEKQANRRK
jgi:hypothetical protein